MPIPVRQFLRLSGVDHFLWMDVDGAAADAAGRGAGGRRR